jgi:hypothetical protein
MALGLLDFYRQAKVYAKTSNVPVLDGDGSSGIKEVHI